MSLRRPLLILLRQVPHVIGHVLPENVCSMNICVEGLGLAVISGESLLGVEDLISPTPRRDSPDMTARPSPSTQMFIEHTFSGNTWPENVCSMNICVEGLGLAVISGESLLGVGDIKSSINSSFQGSE